MSREFDWIDEFFARPFADISHLGPDALGIGDDCALVPINDQQAWAVSTDTLNESIHFTADMPADAIAHKALAVNVSDLMAMGARPKAFFLALSLPKQSPADKSVAWLESFSQGLQQAAQQFDVTLLGGDTCSSAGHISISITVIGEVNPHLALKRSGALPNQYICVSGPLGWAGLGLQVQQGVLTLDTTDQQQALSALCYPQPPIMIGQQLLGTASAAIDVSDGLYGDLGHIAKASRVGVVIDVDQLPVPELAKASLPPLELKRQALFAGEDYQLCYTLPKSQLTQMQAVLGAEYVRLIGYTIEGEGVSFIGQEADQLIGGTSYSHF